MSAVSRGADLERRVKNDLLSKGYNAIRSSASSSPVDIYARSFRGVEYWVQCKTNRNGMYPQEWNTFLAFCRFYDAVPVLATLVRKEKGRGSQLTYYLVLDYKTGNGERQPLSELHL